MRKRIGWLCARVLLCAWILMCLPTTVQAQSLNYEVPPSFTGPFSHDRYETGGFFTALEFVYWHTTNPLRGQVVARRGVIDVDGSISGTPGTFVGSEDPALDVNQLDGPSTWMPGFNLTAGWRFQNGVMLAFTWLHFWEARYTAVAGILPPDFDSGADLANTFLTAPVFNFPVDFAGNPRNIAIGNDNATFGVWNAASSMSMEFQQRFDQYDLSGRIPIWEGQGQRSYGLIGGRIVGIWERFRWRTVDADEDGRSRPEDTATYSNIVSNRLYGAHIGCGHDVILGDGPLGAFAASLDGQGGLFLDFVKERAKYELGDRSVARSRNKNDFSLAPMLSGKLSLWWYPWEAVQIRLGYDVLMYFNTLASQQPVDFNYGAVAPPYSHVFRLYHGASLGVGIVF